ncbi:MAG: Wzz/FepE/Etk N-terminal domain-containing protein [Holdemanella sp.]|uniref:YveK family protein n=1 Tax=Holdemanella sp. TaxID=1971762 RepID=UPI002E7A752E|nr:Wzz/FepE/Etk N-terminal domain-containing protein [Holdemanella sp.]MEE0079829.1 Wzz/FepE/Etk N-terminal domain-containing protein [Holdemanella sp.]
MTNSRLNRTPNSDVREMEEIDLLELFRAILKYIKLIIVLCIVFGAGGFFGTKFLITPTYTARTSIYLTPQISESGSLDYNSQMANSKLVTNVVNLMTQNNIMSEVAKDVGLENSSSVKKCISVTNESNTEIITVTATTTDPKLSKDIANDTVNTFINTMQKNLNVRNIEIVDKAKLSYIPSGPNIKKNTMMASLVGGLIGVGYAVLKFLLDNRLRTKEEAEKYLGIPVFAEFPEV